MNIVEDYLAKNPEKMLSINTLHLRLNLKRKAVRYYIAQSSHIRQVAPLEVGSRKHILSVFTYN